MHNDFFEEIEGKVCVITGGGGVIGTTIALNLAKLGAKIAIIDYKKDRCDNCAKILTENAGTKVKCLVADVLNKDMLVEAREELNKDFGKIDVLVNAAGGNSPSATTKDEFITSENFENWDDNFFGLSLKGFRDVYDLNFLGTLLPSMVFAKDMVNRGGSIINISSMNSFRPLTKIPAYSVAKASVNNFTQWLAVHLAKVNVRVNAIAPGFLLTQQNEFLLIDKKTGGLTERGKKIINSTPMERFGEPEEMVGTVLYLMSDLSKFVTGTVIPVDGGFSAYSGV